MSKVLILPGDGIGQEIVEQALKVINFLNENNELNMALVHGLIGGTAYDDTGSPLPQATLDAAATPLPNLSTNSISPLTVTSWTEMDYGKTQLCQTR
ncbi:MAG: 3-isopropylmalate dehydrogenase [Catillopecten margaritatus gill symbiont]|uniref:3-isopropylmalate dehydrogenase n=1 Tax=Catillopecten margaritatus gill symbiont TaxID=3083288 RepID=A0AAU6PGL7_9GAMM